MKKNFLFLGFLIPQKEMREILLKDKFPAIQTNKFILNFLKGIEYENRMECTYVFAKAISDYPHYPEKNIKKQKIEEKILDKTIKIDLIPFRNTPILKIITRFFWSLYYSLKNYLNVTNKGGVIVYSVHIPFMLTGYLISKIFDIQLVGIWTDPPSISNERESYLKKKLRKIELKISKSLMKKFDKVIVLTKYLAEDFSSCKKYLIMEGILEKNEHLFEKNKMYKENEEVILMYAGSLEKKYGIHNIVKAVRELKNEKITLKIYGKGDYEEELLYICSEDEKIKYFGFLENDEILKKQKEANFLINARNSEDEYVKYSFPSKTLEYMASGTPFITTMLPGIPQEYKNYIIELENNNPETIEKVLREVIKKDKNKLRELGIKAKNFSKSKNYEIQGREIVNFLNYE